MKYINAFQEGDTIIGTYLCKQRNAATTKNGKEYENVVLADRTGTINCKIWEPDSLGIDDFDVNDYVEIKGKVSVYNGAIQMSIDRTRKASEGTYNPADYVPVSPQDPQQMYATILKYVDSVEDPFYKKILTGLFVDDAGFIAAFKTSSAAKSIHHGFVGGLMHHTLSVANLCNYYCKMYPNLDRNLLITAALCHDIGKVKELSAFPQNDYTDEGQLLGHIVIGAMMLNERMDRISNFPQVKRDQLIHCILAHHGEYEFGSPKKPAIIEAVALNFADNTDAKLEAMTEIFENNPNTDGGWLGFNKLFDGNIRPTK